MLQQKKPNHVSGSVFLLVDEGCCIPMPMEISLARFFVALSKKQSIHSFWNVGKGAHIDFIDKAI